MDNACQALPTGTFTTNALPEERSTHNPETDLLPHFIRAEANLLRLPLFALHTKRLKTLDGIECRGRISRNGETHQFTFRATRNTATLYPGPLARAAHLAFLSIITEEGFPLQNPVTWGWRDLCRRMGILYGGQTVRHLKDAIMATSLLGIQSEYALYSKADGKQICTRADTLHLYDRVSFIGTPLPDGGVAERNHLWLSEWYLSNLNAMFTAPIDYALWRYLDQRSPIASRLYEFLLVNFYSGAPVLRINYETLARFLPIRPERYRSDARRQLESAFQLLTSTSVIRTAAWADSKEGLAQLHLYQGERLKASTPKEPGLLPFTTEDFTDGIEVKELRNLKPPEWEIVSDFYRLWSANSRAQPTKRELLQAAELLTQHGPAKMKALLPLLVRRMKAKWPDAKSFGAIIRYVPEAAVEYDHQQRQIERERQEKLRAHEEENEQAQRQVREKEYAARWAIMPEGERAAIRGEVLAKHPYLARHPKLVEKFCIGELSRQQLPTPSSTPSN